MALKKANSYINVENKISKIHICPNILGKKYYLYMHMRDDLDKVFYIGIGTRNTNVDYYRATERNKRSEFWKRVVNKTTYKVFIVEDFDSREECLNREIYYISMFGRKSKREGELVNLTLGGEGGNGISRKLSDDAKKKNSKS